MDLRFCHPTASRATSRTPVCLSSRQRLLAPQSELARDLKSQGLTVAGAGRRSAFRDRHLPGVSSATRKLLPPKRFFTEKRTSAEGAATPLSNFESWLWLTPSSFGKFLLGQLEAAQLAQAPSQCLHPLRDTLAAIVPLFPRGLQFPIRPPTNPCSLVSLICIVLSSSRVGWRPSIV